MGWYGVVYTQSCKFPCPRFQWGYPRAWTPSITWDDSKQMLFRKHLSLQIHTKRARARSARALFVYITHLRCVSSLFHTFLLRLFIFVKHIMFKQSLTRDKSRCFRLITGITTYPNAWPTIFNDFNQSWWFRTNFDDFDESGQILTISIDQKGSTKKKKI